MAVSTSRRDEILEVAEAMIRTVGFNGFSTRDVADAVGIKAASVHHHFPKKADIGVAVTERHTDRFLEGLASRPPSLATRSERSRTMSMRFDVP